MEILLGRIGGNEERDDNRARDPAKLDSPGAYTCFFFFFFFFFFKLIFIVQVVALQD